MLEEYRLFEPNGPEVEAMMQFDINVIPKTMREKIYSSYVDMYMDRYMCFRDWDPTITIKQALEESYKHPKRSQKSKATYARVESSVTVVQNLLKKYMFMHELQFKTYFNNNVYSLSVDCVPIWWVEPILSIIPDFPYNVDILDKEMSNYGYDKVRQQKKKDKDGNSWYYVVYHPKPERMVNVRDLLWRKSFYHYSPEKFHDDIMENGLIPSNGGRTYLYKDKRIFFYVWEHNPEIDDDFYDMMRGIANKEKKADRYFSGIFNCYQLDVPKLPDQDFKMFYDPNQKDCVYVNIHIPSEALIYLEDESLEF